MRDDKYFSKDKKQYDKCLLVLREDTRSSPTKYKVLLNVYLLVMGCFIMAGCQTLSSKTGAHQESTDDVIKAVGTMTEGLTNSAVSKEDLKRLGQQMQKDPEARRAVESVNNAMQVQQTGIRYCPKDGKRYSSRVEKCPVCGAILKDLE